MAQQGNPNDRIISYVYAKEKPIHTFGNVRTSQLVDWELGNPRLRIPEPIELADAIRADRWGHGDWRWREGDSQVSRGF